jgi:hypothetical protein
LHPNLLGEWNELAGRDHRCVADGGDEVALAASDGSMLRSLGRRTAS